MTRSNQGDIATVTPHPEHLHAARDALTFMPTRPSFMQARRLVVWVVLLSCLSMMRAVVRLLPQDFPVRVYLASWTSSEPWRWRDLPQKMGWR